MQELTINESNVMHREVRHFPQAEETASIGSNCKFIRTLRGLVISLLWVLTGMENVSISLHCSFGCAAVHLKVIAVAHINHVSPSSPKKVSKLDAGRTAELTQSCR